MKTPDSAPPSANASQEGFTSDAEMDDAESDDMEYVFDPANPWEPPDWSAPYHIVIAIDYHLHTYLFDLGTRKRFFDEVINGELVPDRWEPEQLEFLRRASFSLYRRLIDCARAGWPERDHDEMVLFVGNLVSLLDRWWLSTHAESQAEWLSPDRMLVIASALEAGPHEGKRAIKMLDSRDRPAAIERALRQLHDSVIGHETAIVLLVFHLPIERQDELVLTLLSSSRREDVRLTLLKVLTLFNDEPQMGTVKPLFSMEATVEIVRRGLIDPAPRVRRQAASCAVGLGLVERFRREIEDGAQRDPDGLARETFEAVLEYADRVGAARA